MSLMARLLIRHASDWNIARKELCTELREIFPDDTWGIEAEISNYTDANYDNLWRNELRRSIRSALESAGITVEEYGGWLAEVHFINVAIWHKGVFEEYKSNVGWRIVLLSVPSLSIVVVGLASHYQGGQRHNRLGEASNLLYDAARQGLERPDSSAKLSGRKVSPNDWDQDGLLTTPFTSICGIDVSALPQIDSLYLKDVRTTTLKKVLASFITIESVAPTTSDAQLSLRLGTLRDTALELASAVYPFRTVDEFEPLRSLALQDVPAASLRIQLRHKSSTRSVVRVYYGPPGTGKTLQAVREAVRLIDPSFNDDGQVERSFARFSDLSKNVAFVTFHQSLQYEDVFECIRPVLASSYDDEVDSDESQGESSRTKAGNLSYRIHEGLLLRMIRKAAANPGEEFVVVVDEINRGDVSRIFGPLLSSIEPDKRVGAEFPLGVELQYPRSGELETRLFVPSNLHFLGTMNSSDRNIALVDHALRRRFEFVEVPPVPGLLHPTSDASPIDCRRLLEVMNSRIEFLLDRDHCIGHGYFMACTTNAAVVERMARRVLPLLREYFYGNEGSMLLVLGDTPGGSENIHLISEPDTHFSELFSVDQATAALLGYRAHNAPIVSRVDARFWNSERLLPGPEDEQYAVRAIKKIYEHPGA